MAGSSLGTTPQTAGANSQHSSMLPTDDGGGCGGDTKGGFRPNDGGGCCGGDGGNWDGGGGGEHHCRVITVKPRAIYFTASSSGPVTATVSTRQQGTISEVDDCGGASGVATLTEGTGSQANQWTVAPGAQTGQCKALFILKNTSGQKLGHAVLHITNFI